MFVMMMYYLYQKISSVFFDWSTISLLVITVAVTNLVAIIMLTLTSFINSSKYNYTAPQVLTVQKEEHQIETEY